jgi:hypothetical protein
MSSIVVGPVLDALGLAQRTYLVRGRDYPQVRRRSWATPATQLRSRQPASNLNLNHDHGLTLGPIVWLERDEAMRCWAVCATEHDVPADRRWFYSAETDSARDGSDVVLTGIGLVDATAQTGLQPVVVLPGRLTDYRLRGARHALDEVPATILGHAAEDHRPWQRDRGDTLAVHDMREHGQGERHADAPPPGAGWHDYDGRPCAPPTGHATGAVLNVR